MICPCLRQQRIDIDIVISSSKLDGWSPRASTRPWQMQALPEGGMDSRCPAVN